MHTRVSVPKVSMLTLYTTAVSANGRKVLALAKHLELEVDVRIVNVYRGEGQSPEYRAINPWGKVPTLQDGDLVLWESNGILVYLAEGYAGSRLWSRDAKARANILRWLFWESAHWQPALTRVLAARAAQLLFPEHAGVPAPVCWDDAEVKRLLGVMDSELLQRQYVCGSELSIADFSLAGMTTYFGATGFPSAQFRGVAAWIGRMNDVPAWRATLVAPWADAL